MSQGHCHLPVAKSRLCYKYIEVDFATYKEPRIFRNANRPCGRDIISGKWEGGIDFQVVSEASANGGNDCKGMVKPSWYFELDSTGNSPSSLIHTVSSEKANSKYMIFPCRTSLSKAIVETNSMGAQYWPVIFTRNYFIFKKCFFSVQEPLKNN